MIGARVILDSVQPDGIRLTTMEITLPRVVLAEFNTHRAFSRGSASSRAIPVATMIQRVIDDPFIPSEWGTNKPGMQAGEPLSQAASDVARYVYLQGRDCAVDKARTLAAHGVHKQIVNRLIEPWLFTTVLVTGADDAYRHFFALRCHPAAQPEIRMAAEAARTARDGSEPRALDYGEWHMPYVDGVDWEAVYAMGRGCDSTLLRTSDVLRKISVARCARVSYLKQGVRSAVADDLKRYESLANPGDSPPHASPFEHVARAAEDSGQTNPMCGNFRRGWVQLRKTLKGEYVS